MKKIISVCLLATLSGATVIKEIKFSGLNHLSNTSALNITGLKIGEKLDLSKVNKAILNLYKQNYFDNIAVKENNGILNIIVTEKPSIAKITVTGIASNDRKQIESILGIKKGNLFDESSAKEACDRIKNYYEARSYFDTIVEYKTKTLNNTDGLELEFIVNRGENIIINNVYLSGAKKLSYSNIEPAVINKEKEFMGWMWGRNDGKLKIFELNNDSARISDEYMKKGYLDVQVSAPYLKTYTDIYQADLTYFIKEGKPYKIKNISIENPLFEEKQNLKTIKNLRSSVGKIINIEDVRKDVKTLETQSADLGYAFVEVYPDIQKNDETHEATINFKVIPHEKVYIRNVIIANNSRTVDRVIRRELYITEGNLYNRTDLTESKNALKRTSYFDDVNIKEKKVDDTHIDLIVDVKEASTGAISGGIGYGSSDGLLLNASLSDTNIFGSGIKSSVSVDKSNDTLSGRISLLDPRVLDSQYSLGGTLYSNDYEWDNYSEKNYGFDITVGRQFARYYNVSLTYNLEQSDIYHLSPTLLRTGYDLGKSIKSSISPALSFNNTDDYYLPRSGIIASTSLEYAGIGGDQKFLSSSTRFNFYQGLQDYIGYDLIYRYKASFYKVWNRGYLPINQRIYLGGIRSIRGFESRTVSPKNEWGDEVGGTIAFANSVELSFPLIDRIKLRGSMFFDYGMIGRKNLDEIKRMSTGVGLEWITPIGPLQLIFAKPLNKKKGDDTSTFEFNLGTRF
ncbi:outer membrane protein assembly factor BamA [Campylobacter sp. RM10532]|uniref:Outer membrane protein assembly factor BamA n=1 Tax=Campylobacter molothri TaxID=1032242 RepID=A0ACC5W2P4_9BACT|nr:outer membrane protein assembly factor BamA [Campylobacter sp. RM10542]MBZ7931810.1 outer membrane protein assembly factor BamA [Campylobacter sp. RM12910]MBZ7933242.1 outer membrane protein assembly factor BamA [Campylobacter sp. RM10543]MBZ7944048.1 outer membrane protein assembly factor BamA [Campylobacter sp. RM13744]MBZ7945649.1 outer membrane protein assembly factor BamA [Campylobacter sp. RM10532]MBZ7958764.1 outer membrane protein assembly factor BamA [Campylobacter sp. RM9760]MBZ7